MVVAIQYKIANVAENINQVLPVTACSSEGISYLGFIYEEPLLQLLLDVKSQGQIAFDKSGKNVLNLLIAE